ncbi:nucleic acid-binding protein [Phanerochaete sordida]|uniref:Nucleic acid-binding protein n=1 Tax=Phanerochaete sordida TaxID=48140 RepID=A0A9P3LJ47_9APHY|nr:nucleic acid-binding protein [Phanerochaete sordida]
MSVAASIAKLHSPLRELVSTVADAHHGKSEKDKAEVSEWIEKVAAGDAARPEAIQALDAQLTPKTYIVSNYFTAADVALYGALHPTLAQLQPAQYYAHPSVTRYFDHIQHKPSVRAAAAALAPAFDVVPFDLDGAPSIERKADPPKEKKKAPKAEPAASGSAPAPAQKKAKKEAAQAADEDVNKDTGAPVPQQKKEKKEKKPAQESKKAVAEDAGEPVPSMIDLRVGRIVDIKKHPDADSLYVEQIDFGEETGPRTVVSGLVNYIPIEKMQNKTLVGVCNLKPANMRGVKSFAMVLCATHKDGKDAGLELIEPPAGSEPGERIYFEGPEFENAEPLSQLNPKKKIFETIQPGFTTLESHEAAWVNPVTKQAHRIRTAKGVCYSPNFVGASLS